MSDYTVSDFSYPSATTTYVRGISESGVIFGDYGSTTGSGSFIYRNGIFSNIAYAGAVNTTIENVTPSGKVAGSYTDNDGRSHGFIYDGNYTTFDVPNSTSTAVTDINASGQILGTYADSSTRHGFVYSNGTVMNVDVPGARQTDPSGIDDAGHIYGTDFASPGGATTRLQGFVYDHGNFSIEEAHVSGVSTFLQGITESDQLFGYTFNNGIHGFVGTGGKYASLDIPGATEIVIGGVDAVGDVAGYYLDSSFNEHGFVAHPVTVTQPLPPSQGLFGTLVHDEHSVGGQVYALYDGLLGRAPDPLGLEGWANALSHGESLHDIAQAFLTSPEGQARASALDNASFVEQLYGATLHRHSDAAGLSAWTQQLNAGSARADVALGFALSPEHLTSLQSVFTAGVFVPDADAANVARLYYAVLDRAPDTAGLSYWTNIIDEGASYTDVTRAFLKAPEVQAKTGGLTNAQYVDAIYENALGRHADVDGLALWTSQLDQDASRVGVTTSIGLSAEAQTHHLSEIELGWHLS